MLVYYLQVFLKLMNTTSFPQAIVYFVFIGVLNPVFAEMTSADTTSEVVGTTITKRDSDLNHEKQLDPQLNNSTDLKNDMSHAQNAMEQGNTGDMQQADTVIDTPVMGNIPVPCSDIQQQSKIETDHLDCIKTDQPMEVERISEPVDFKFLGDVIPRGEKKRLAWSAGQSFAGRSIDTPVVVIRGIYPGPKLCLTAAVHGDELNGVEIVLRLVNSIKPKELRGTLIAVPIVNILGLTRNSRYLPDRRDLNRYFPGNVRGSAASRIAHAFFHQVITHCDYLVDFHTGSGKRTNLPQLRADLNDPNVYQFTQNFGATVVMHHSGNPGMLRKAAIDAGIPAVTFELGEPGTLQIKHVEYGIAAIETLMAKLDMLKRFRLWSEPQPRYYNSTWIRTDYGGVLISKIKLGDSVAQNDLLGWISNPISNERTPIHANVGGRILGMALNQFVLPGFAAYHIGVDASKSLVSQQFNELVNGDTEQEPKLVPITHDAASIFQTSKPELSQVPDPDEPLE